MHKQFGNAQTIGIECEVTPQQGEAASVWRGRVWLTVDRQIVGNQGVEAQEQIGIAINALAMAGRNTGKKDHGILHGIQQELALDLVMWAVYGDNGKEFAKMVPNRESLHILEILPSVTGPAFDGWEAMLIESGDTECFVWRTEGKRPTQSGIFPIGTFWRATEDAKSWMDDPIHS